MSWRLSWYKANKENPIVYEEESYEIDNGETYIERCPIVNGDKVLWNEGTDILCDMTKEEINNPLYFREILKEGEFEFHEVTKEGLKYFIEKYKERIIKIFEEALKSDDERHPFYPSLKQYAKEKLRNWKYNVCVDLRPCLDEDIYNVTNDLSYEYCIFNLVALYKNFDFENNMLVIHGG